MFEFQDRSIIDEDIILNCMTINQIHIPLLTLMKMLNSLDAESELAKKISLAAKAAKTKSLFTLPQIKYDIAYDVISTPIDITSFCRAEKFYFKKMSDENDLSENSHLDDSLVFLKPLKLDHNVKYIMMSATADEIICNYCFGSQWVEFYQCKKAKYTGTLNQYTDGTMSRAYIDKNPGIIDKTMKATGFKNLITFKKYKSQGMYFGKTTGIDLLKGKDLNVIGTPHQPAWIYKLFAYTLGFDVNENARMFYRMVKYKDFSFWFMTFNDELLRSIQFWMIESELEQAAGRARLLRENCTVNLFSNFPLGQAVLKD